jgi:hypothetical protein
MVVHGQEKNAHGDKNICRANSDRSISAQPREKPGRLGHPAAEWTFLEEMLIYTSDNSDLTRLWAFPIGTETAQSDSIVHPCSIAITPHFGTRRRIFAILRFTGSFLYAI